MTISSHHKHLAEFDSYHDIEQTLQDVCHRDITVSL